MLKSLSRNIYLNSFSMFLWHLLIPERVRGYTDDIKAARNYGGEGGMEGHKAKIVFGSLDVRQKSQ